MCGLLFPSEGPWKALFITFVIFALLGLFGFVLFKHRDRLTGETYRQFTDIFYPAHHVLTYVLCSRAGKQTTKNESDKLSEYYHSFNSQMKVQDIYKCNVHFVICGKLV